MGKTAPMDPTRTIPANPPVEDRTYPNRWMEERNLRALHKSYKKGQSTNTSVDRSAFANNNLNATCINIMN